METRAFIFEKQFTKLNRSTVIMKINLIIFLSRFGVGGAGNSIFRLCKGLPKKKFNISIICLNNCPYDKKNNAYDCERYKEPPTTSTNIMKPSYFNCKPRQP